MNQTKSTMQSNLKIGPIRKARPEANTIHAIIRKRANDMRVGEAFDISGISGKRELANLRAYLNYAGRKDGFRVTTSFKGETLSIEKLRKNGL
jgi:hypothetical protein